MDSFWQDVIDHIKATSPDGSAYAAPRPFKDALTSVIPYSDLTNHALDDFSGLVIHKGAYKEIDASFLYQIIRLLAPTFANPVFIVLEKIGERLPSRDEHLGTLSEIKEWAAMNADPSVRRPVGFETPTDGPCEDDDAILTAMVN